MKFLCHNLLFFIVLFASFALDIFSKYAVFEHFGAVITMPDAQPPGTTHWQVNHKLWVPSDYKPLEVIPCLFTLRVVLNLGAVWGSFHGQTFLLTLFALIAIAFILYLVWRNRYTASYQILLGLILGGAVANLWDRMFFGGVRDFLDFYIGTNHWPTFNLADCYIVLGILGYLYVEWRHDHNKQPVETPGIKD
jgi:signal peptidase II